MNLVMRCPSLQPWPYPKPRENTRIDIANAIFVGVVETVPSFGSPLRMLIKSKIGNHKLINHIALRQGFEKMMRVSSMTPCWRQRRMKGRDGGTTYC